MFFIHNNSPYTNILKHFAVKFNVIIWGNEDIAKYRWNNLDEDTFKGIH